MSDDNWRLMRKRRSGATYKARKLRRENWIVGGENEVNDPHGDTRFRNVLPIQYVKMLFGGSSFVEVKERNNLTKSYKHLDLRAARPVIRMKPTSIHARWLKLKAVLH